jgi:hypothetical protein
MALVALLYEMKGANNGEAQNNPCSDRMFHGRIIGGPGIILCAAKISSSQTRHDG